MRSGKYDVTPGKTVPVIVGLGGDGSTHKGSGMQDSKAVAYRHSAHFSQRLEERAEVAQTMRIGKALQAGQVEAKEILVIGGQRRGRHRWF